jgi:putative hydrolase of the HAD superfamily
VAVRAVCFDWGGTLMSEIGPEHTPMGAWPAVTALPGAKECLASLHGAYPISIATNASVSRRSMIERALERVGLLGYISHVFCYTELGFRKDQIGFWRAVESALGMPLQEIAMLGDSLEQDVIAPASFGVRSVWFNDQGRYPSPATPVRTVTRLEEFAAMVKNGI